MNNANLMTALEQMHLQAMHTASRLSALEEILSHVLSTMTVPGLPDYEARALFHLEAHMRRAENVSPKLAAKMQQMLDDTRAKVKGQKESSGES